jgi:DNA-binding transcriptional ArsR family regulator
MNWTSPFLQNPVRKPARVDQVDRHVFRGPARLLVLQVRPDDLMISRHVSRSASMSTEGDLKLLSVLSNPIRVEVLIHLAWSEKCVADIATDMQLDQSTISHALRKLLDVELVERQVIKKNRVYKLSRLVRVTTLNEGVQLDVITDALHLAFKASK